jgi:hypothetical protein
MSLFRQGLETCEHLLKTIPPKLFQARQAEDLQVKCAIVTYFDTACIVMYRSGHKTRR